MTYKVSKRYYPFAANEKGEIMNVETGNIRKPCLGKHGYYMVGSRQDTFLVHRIVADAWCENDDPENKTDVNHIDGNKLNNKPENLEWCTRKHNMIHAAQNSLLNCENRKRGEDCNLTQHSEELIRKACELLQDGLRNVDVAKATGIGASYIKDLRNGRAWSHLTKEYNFPERPRQSLSEVTVRWICREIVQGTGNVDIVKKARNPLVTLHTVKNIKYKKCYTSISNEYF